MSTLPKVIWIIFAIYVFAFLFQFTLWVVSHSKLFRPWKICRDHQKKRPNEEKNAGINLIHFFALPLSCVVWQNVTQSLFVAMIRHWFNIVCEFFFCPSFLVLCLLILFQCFSLSSLSVGNSMHNGSEQAEREKNPLKVQFSQFWCYLI